MFGGTNLYQYAPNPVSWVDPFGLSSGKAGCDIGCDEFEKYLAEIPDSTIKHSNIGEFTKNPRTGELSKMKGGGHGQENIKTLEDNGFDYNIEYEYPNGVRIGNVPDHKTKSKRTGTNQSWFPESWTDKDIADAGANVIGNTPNYSSVADGQTIFGEYNGVRVGVIKTAGKPATIFPDANNQP